MMIQFGAVRLKGVFIVQHSSFICFLFGYFLLGTIFFAGNVSAMDINVTPDRNPVRLNESFSLTFAAQNNPDGDPDFSPLKENFDIVNQSQSSNISVVNGDYSKSIEWILTLMPKTTGSLVVPPISFGSDQSQPLTMQVLNASQSNVANYAELLLEVSAQPENPYVQAQSIFTVRFLRRVDIAQASLTDLALDNVMVQKLGEDRSFSVWRNGYQYAVTERKYAIFPQQSGSISIPALELKAEVVTSGRRGFFSRRNTMVRRIQSNAISLNVRPVPSAFTGDYWLPAKRVVLEEKWSNSPPSVAVGEPLTHTLRLFATGVPQSSLPELGKLQIEGDGRSAIKQYPDQPVLEEQKTLSGIVSSQQQKTALIPSKPGSYQVEGIEIPWWNTETDRMEVARLPGTTMKALPSNSSESNPPEVVETSKQVIKPNSEAVSPTSGPMALSDSKSDNRFWFWASVALAIGWAATVIYFLANKLASKEGKSDKELEQSASERRSVRLLKQACRDNDPIEAKNALLAWGQLHWPQSLPQNLENLAAMVDADFGDEIHNLSHSLYGRGGAVWNGLDCWKAFSSYKDEPKKRLNKKAAELEPLFKI